MKNNKWIPILMLTIMAAVFAMVVVNVSKAGKKKTEKNIIVPENETVSVIESKAAEKGTPVTGVIASIDAEAGMLKIYGIAKMDFADYTFDLGTDITNKYGEAIAPGRLTPGQIVEVTPEKGKSRAVSVKRSGEAWSYKGIREIEIDKTEYIIYLGDREYQFDSHLLVFAKDGRQITLDELSEKDILIATGIEGKIHSLCIQRGHGTMTFSNFRDFYGGSVEIGYDIFGSISEGMSFDLREGTYKVVLKNDGLSVNKYITVEADKTVNVDLNEYRNEVDKEGLISVNVRPSDAEVYIDGKLTDADIPFKLAYGEYVLEVKKEGYKPVSRLLTVGKPTVNLKIDLADSTKEEKDESLSDLTNFNDPVQDLDDIVEIEDDDLENSDDLTWIDEPEEETTTVDGEYISIKKPEGATAYLDGQKIGVVPVRVTKVTGEHQIMFTKDGYITKTYIVEIDNDGEDAVFSFPDLSTQ